MPTRKLIEVALPLEAINAASAREKSIRHGHPSTLHLWWARRPLAACRAVLFASLVDDPSSHPDRFPTEEAQQRERERLFGIIERLVKWENSNNEHVLREAREEILKHTDGNPPPVYDPFAGGGSIPLEAQRLGLEAHASDLNPVAVLINKALIEIPPRFANMPPVNPEDRNRIGADWKGAAGLAADVRYYGKWMRDEAEKRIGHLYPKVRLPKEYGGGEATVIAWLWARTVKCPNPACAFQTPIAKTFSLSSKSYLKVTVDQSRKDITFKVCNGSGEAEPGNVTRSGARCLLCSTPIELSHIRSEAIEGRMGQELLAIVAEGNRRRVYLDANEVHRDAALKKTLERDVFVPTTDLPDQALGFRVQRYGMKTHASLFSRRQVVALGVFAELVQEVAEEISETAKTTLYGQAVATYLSFALDKAANYWSSLCSWYVNKEIMVSTFGLPTLSMVWDFAEANPFSSSSGNWMLGVEQAAEALENLPVSLGSGSVFLRDAAQPLESNEFRPLVITDPPYYDNIGYAALSDFFYIWLRQVLTSYYPELFTMMLTPKSTELIAEPGRFENDRSKAIEHFETGLFSAFEHLRKSADSNVPLSLFYAFKQQEQDIGVDGSAHVSTGWETLLDALIRAGFLVCGTWPVRTEQPGGLREAKRNALASSIVLVCRPRPEDAPAATRREFLNALRAELPSALRRLQQGNIAPVDLAQAAIGPGMAVFSRYSKVVESDGSPMRVRTALQIINQELDAVLAEQEGEFDSDTRWAIAWFDQYGVNEGPYGVAETLSKAKNTSVEGMVEAGIVVARSGKVRLLRRDELPGSAGGSPAFNGGRAALAPGMSVWQVAQHLVHALDKRGEGGAAALLAQLGGEGEIARDLAYRLYTTCERKGWAQEALAYNSLVVSWPEIRRLAAEAQRGGAVQGRMEI